MPSTLDTLLTPPPETVPNTSRRAVLLGVLAVAIAVVITNVAATVWLDRVPYDLGAEVVRTKWALIDEAVAEGAEPVDVLLIGDSSCNQGVRPSQLTEGTSLRALNLCTIGSETVADDAWLLAEYIERVGTPDAVVAIHSWDVWRRDDSGLRTTTWKIPGGPARFEDHAPSLDLTFKERVVAQYGAWLPLYTRATLLRWALRSPFAVQSSTFTPDGFMEPPGALGSAMDRVEEHLERARTRPWSVSEWNHEAVSAFLALTQANDIQVVLASGPVHASLLEDPAFVDWLDDYARWAADIAEQHAHVSAVDPFYEVIPADEMESADHTDAAGATRYTQALAERLRAEGILPRL